MVNMSQTSMECHRSMMSIKMFFVFFTSHTDKACLGGDLLNSKCFIGEV